MTTMIKFHIILFFLLTSCSQHKKDQQGSQNTVDIDTKVLKEKKEAENSTPKNKWSVESWSHSHVQKTKKKYNSEHPQVDVFTLQEKLKAKGYYRGPINGVVTDETRKALEKFMGRK